MEQKKTRKKSNPGTEKIPLEALSFIETRGKTGTIGALDIMPKTSAVRFVSRINIGSGMVTVIYMGEVAAARSANQAARDLTARIGELVTSNVIPRPNSRIYEVINQRSGEETDVGVSGSKRFAVGMVETDGFVGMIEAADQGIKAADVLIPGWVTVGSGLTTVFFRGEVAAVHSAVESGCIAAEKVSKVIAAHVIAQPHIGTEQAAPIGKYKGENVFKEQDRDAALGILETKGIAGLIEGIDAGLKASSVIVQGWEKIGRGITSTLFRGTVADVRAAMDAAVKGAEKVSQVVGSYIIARPHQELDKGK
jgi:microcompartment protein CcmL/EutN